MALSEKIKMLIEEFADTKSIQALEQFSGMPNSDAETVNLIAKMFGFSGDFADFINGGEENKLLASFKHNLALLIQKTWVEKSDITLKEQILFRLESFYSANDEWNETYKIFLEIIVNAVYLMFGQQTKSDDFAEYSLRIDPEFGIFWNYIQSLPQNTDWDGEKCRNAVLLGMFFLANY